MDRHLPMVFEDGFHLQSGVDLHNNAPSTFLIPSDEEKAGVGVGNIVKLVFHIRTIRPEGEEMNIERMWVIVMERDGDWLKGVLDNDPVFTDDMKAGLPLYFHPEHIIQIHDMKLDINTDKFRGYQALIDSRT